MNVSFNGWADDREKKRELKFEATCYHEAGHVIAALDVENGRSALGTVIVRKPDKLGFLSGTTGVDLAKLPEGSTAIVAFGGFLAESKAYAEAAYGASRCVADQWDQVLDQLMLLYLVIDPEESDRLFPLFINVETDEGRFTSSGCVTAIDLLLIPQNELDEEHLLTSLQDASSLFDDEQKWQNTAKIARELKAHPDEEFSKEKLLSIIG